MSRAQTIAVWVGIVLVVLMGVFPPWNRVSDAPTYHLERSAGYAPVFLPPLDLLRYRYIRVNVRRLLVQWGAVATNPKRKECTRSKLNSEPPLECRGGKDRQVLPEPSNELMQ